MRFHSIFFSNRDGVPVSPDSDRISSRNSSLLPGGLIFFPGVSCLNANHVNPDR